jgi:hypothetical protein
MAAPQDEVVRFFSAFAIAEGWLNDSQIVP